MNRRTAALSACLALAACGTEPAAPLASADTDALGGLAGLADTGALPDTAGVADAADASATTVSPLATCDVEIAWFTDAVAQWLEPTVFETSPNDGLLWGAHHDSWRSSVFRMASGEVLSTSNTRPAMDTDTAWERRLAFTQDEGLVVADILTDNVLGRLAPGTRSVRTAVFANDDTQVAFAHCEDGRMIVEVWDVEPSPSRHARLVVPNPDEDRHWYCGDYQSRPKIAVVGPNVFFAGSTAAALERWNVETGEHTQVFSVTPIPEAERRYWDMDVATVVASPDDRHIAAVATDGLLRMIDARTGAVLYAIPAPYDVLNENTYAPQVAASPVAFTHDSRLFAATTGDNRIALYDTNTGRMRAEMQVPPDQPNPDWGTEDAIARLTFTRDDRGLLVQSMFGVTAFTCLGARLGNPPMNSVLEVTLTGPPVVRAGQEIRFSYEVQGYETELLPSRYFIDGELLAQGGLGNEMRTSFGQPGPLTLTVEVDDGRRQGYASLEINVE